VLDLKLLQNISWKLWTFLIVFSKELIDTIVTETKRYAQ
jgi:hypothetical protein